MFEQAKKLVTSEFIILYRKNSLGYSRLGLALSKKWYPKHMIEIASNVYYVKDFELRGYLQ
nr:hypothetical protein [Legionella tunisiensis]